MDESIAIIMKDYSVSNSFFESSHIIVMSKDENGWAVSSELPINFNNKSGIASLRSELLSLSKKLGKCKIIAGIEITGLPFTVFDSLGFHIFSISELNDASLDGIIEDIRSNDENNKIPQKPIETSIPGKYYFDLAMLQENFPEISSKKALRKFFKETPFWELELVCTHLPPWINEFGYDITLKKQDGKTVAVIKNKLCGKEPI